MGENMFVLTDLSQYDTLDREVEQSQLDNQVRALVRHAESHITEEQYCDLHSFTFRDAYLLSEELCANIAAEELGNPKRFTQDTHHNAVRLRSGDVIPIPSWPRPEIPGLTNVTVTRSMKVTV
jgi:hypothetical protein